MIVDLLKMALTKEDKKKVIDLIDNMNLAISNLDRAIDLQEKTRGAFRSKLIAESRSQTEKAREILREIMHVSLET